MVGIILETPQAKYMCEIESFQPGKINYRNTPRGEKRGNLDAFGCWVRRLLKTYQWLTIRQKIISISFTFSLLKCIINSIILAELTNFG